MKIFGIPMDKFSFIFSFSKGLYSIVISFLIILKSRDIMHTANNKENNYINRCNWKSKIIWMSKSFIGSPNPLPKILENEG